MWQDGRTSKSLQEIEIACVSCAVSERLTERSMLLVPDEVLLVGDPTEKVVKAGNDR